MKETEVKVGDVIALRLGEGKVRVLSKHSGQAYCKRFSPNGLNADYGYVPYDDMKVAVDREH